MSFHRTNSSDSNNHVKIESSLLPKYGTPSMLLNSAISKKQNHLDMTRNSKNDEHAERKPLANCYNTHHTNRNRDPKKELKTSMSQMCKVPINKTEPYKINSLEGPTISWDPFADNEDSHSEITALTTKSQDDMLAANTSKIPFGIKPRRVSTFNNGRQMNTTNPSSKGEHVHQERPGIDLEARLRNRRAKRRSLVSSLQGEGSSSPNNQLRTMDHTHAYTSPATTETDLNKIPIEKVDKGVLNTTQEEVEIVRAVLTQSRNHQQEIVEKTLSLKEKKAVITSTSSMNRQQFESPHLAIKSLKTPSNVMEAKKRKALSSEEFSSKEKDKGLRDKVPESPKIISKREHEKAVKTAKQKSKVIAFETGLRLKTAEQRITSLMKEIDEIRFFQEIEDLGHGSNNVGRGKGDIITAKGDKEGNYTKEGYEDFSAAAAAVSEADARVDNMSVKLKLSNEINQNLSKDIDRFRFQLEEVLAEKASLDATVEMCEMAAAAHEDDEEKISNLEKSHEESIQEGKVLMKKILDLEKSKRDFQKLDKDRISALECELTEANLENQRSEEIFKATIRENEESVKEYEHLILESEESLKSTSAVLDEALTDLEAKEKDIDSLQKNADDSNQRLEEVKAEHKINIDNLERSLIVQKQSCEEIKRADKNVKADEEERHKIELTNLQEEIASSAERHRQELHEKDNAAVFLRKKLRTTETMLSNRKSELASTKDKLEKTSKELKMYIDESSEMIDLAKAAHEESDARVDESEKALMSLKEHFARTSLTLQGMEAKYASAQCTIDGLRGSLSSLETSAVDTKQQHESVLNEMKEAAGRGGEAALELQHKLDEISSKYASNELLLEDRQKEIGALKTVLENNEANIKNISELNTKIINLEKSLNEKSALIKDKDHCIEEHKNILINFEDELDKAEAHSKCFEADHDKAISMMKNTHKEEVEELRGQIKLKEEQINDFEEKLMKEFKGKAVSMDASNNLCHEIEEAKLIALERDAQLSALNQALEENRSKKEDLVETISKHENSLEKVQNMFNEAKKKIAQQQELESTVAELRRKLSDSSEDLLSKNDKLSNLEENFNELEKKLKLSGDEVLRYDEILVREKRSIIEYSQRLRSAEQEVSEVKISEQEMNFIVLKLQRSLNEANDEISMIKKKASSVDIDKSTIKLQLENAADKLRLAENDLEKIRTSLDEHKVALSEAENELALSREENTSKQAAINDLLSSQEHSQSCLESLNADNERFYQEKKVIEVKLSKAYEELLASKRAFAKKDNSTEHDSVIFKLKDEKESLQSEVSSLEATLEMCHDSLTEAQEEAKKKIEEYEMRLVQAQEIESKTRNEFEEVSSIKCSIERELKFFQNDAHHSTKEIETLNEELRKQENMLSGARKELSYLKSQERSESAQNKASVDEARKNVLDKEKDLHTANEEILKMKLIVSKASERIDQLQLALQNHDAEVTTFKSAETAALDRVDQLTDALNSVKNKYRRTESETKEKRSMYEARIGELEAKVRKKNATSDNYAFERERNSLLQDLAATKKELETKGRTSSKAIEEKLIAVNMVNELTESVKLLKQQQRMIEIGAGKKASEAESKNQHTENLYVKAKSQLEGMSNSVDSLRSEVAHLEECLKDSSRQLDRAKQDLRNHKKEYAAANKQDVHSYRHKIEELSMEIDRMAEKLRSKEAKMEEISYMKTRLERLSTRNADLESQLDIANLRATSKRRDSRILPNVYVDKEDMSLARKNWDAHITSKGSEDGEIDGERATIETDALQRYLSRRRHMQTK